MPSHALAALTAGGRLVAYSSGSGMIRAYDLLFGIKSAIGFQMARGEFAPEEATEAHAAVESRVNRGKAVLHP